MNWRQGKPTNSKQRAWRKPCQYWAEVYISPKWVTVDILNGRVDCPTAVERLLLEGNKNMTKSGCSLKQILYIVAANVDESLKDVTKRYTIPQYMTSTKQ